MKRITAGLLTLLTLFPSGEVSAKKFDRDIYAKSIKSGVETYVSQDSVALRTEWDNETKSVKVTDYPNIGWDTIMKYIPEKNAISFQIESPHEVHENYIKLFNQGIQEIENNTNKKDRKEKLNVIVIHGKDISPNSSGEEYTQYSAEMENTPLPGWRTFIIDYTGNHNPPEINIDPNERDIHMLFKLYKEIRKKQENVRTKLEF